ncbi:hypothetical protein JG688_00009460 [Phytophthora aleatoria]|uniref:Uncharacterized protein n=1 Tax=Phytophthora aleatoria TaxID=2496075 RepID=A0A8J5J3F9_9STRA|nr:hypothetical protein JG688_00009460 [Phytophthora aleatoria]
MRERVAAVFTGRVLEGRGRRWNEWVSWLYLQLLNEIDLLRKLGLKFDASMRLQLALRLLKTSIGSFNCTSVDKAGALVVEKLSPRWIQTCMEARQIHLRTKSGKTQVSPEKQVSIEREVAAHLGELEKLLKSGQLNEETI